VGGGGVGGGVWVVGWGGGGKGLIPVSKFNEGNCRGNLMNGEGALR